MKEVIIDIETLSTATNASVATIGIIIFNRNEKQISLDELKKENRAFYFRILKSSCDELNLDISKETLTWWKKQPKDSYYEVFEHPDRISIKDALEKINKLCYGTKTFWSQGHFDYPILSEIYKLFKLETPWKFWQIRDSRTLFDVCNIDIKSINTTGYHNALNDCYRQYVGTLESIKLVKDKN